MRLPVVLNKKFLHTSINLARGPLKFPGWYPRDHKPNSFSNSEEERRTSALHYGLRPEDYRVINKDDVKRYCGDYPDLGIVTFSHKDPYENYTDRLMRRNWNEPVSKEYMTYRPDRLSFTNLDAENYTKIQGVVNILMMLLPIIFFSYYAINSNSKSMHWKNPVMPKQYPYDMNRAWPMDNPCLYPIENYSFDPAV